MDADRLSIGDVLSQFDQSKAERDEKLDAIRDQTAETIDGLKDSDPVRQLVSGNGKALPTSFKALTKKLMRQQIVKDGKRVDGRSLDQVTASVLGLKVGRCPFIAVFPSGVSTISLPKNTPS